MLTKSWMVTRRTVLRGLGTAMALPWLEAMATASAPAAQVGPDGIPTRMAFLYVPNGIHMEDWTPAAEGRDFTLPRILEALTPFQEDMLVLSGLTADKARANGDGPGDHARALSAFLTGVQPYKTDGADIRAGISVDQVAAQRLGHLTRLPSLEIGCERGRQAGNCDSGYSCAYSSNISWRSESTPMPKEINPRLVFDRLFGTDDADENDEGRARRRRYRRSILDFVLEDAQSLQRRLGGTDRRKVEEYLTSVRELELRIARAETNTEVEVPDGYEVPDGVPKDYAEHVRLMNDLLALAFQTDTTRIATFVIANEGSNRSYPNLDITDGHHYLSHHGGDSVKHDKLRAINTFHIQQFAALLKRLKETPEGDGTLLDHSMILYGSGIGDGNRHNHNDLPILLLGQGGGTLTTGRHVRYADETPLNNLYLSMLDRMEAPVEDLGDSTGRLPKLL